MIAKQVTAMVLIFTWLAQECAFARPKAPAVPKGGQLAWSELGKVVVDKQVATTLTNGKKIEGEVLAIRPNSMVLDIRKTSDRKAYPKGQTEVPRELVSRLRVIRHRGPFGLVGGILGTVGGVATAGYMTYVWYAAGAVTGFALVLPAMAVSGYYAGKAADRRTSTITIAPEAATSGEVLQLAAEVLP